MSTAADEQVEQDEPETPETPVAPETGDATEETGDEPGEPKVPAEEPVEPEAAAILTEQETEKRFASIEKRAATWRRTVADVLGELALDLEVCPRCLPMVPGFIYPIRSVPIPDEQRVAVKLSLGELAPPDLKPDKHSHVCDDCNGHGKVLTGSHVLGQESARCTNCKGKGWAGPREAMATQGQADPVATLPVDGAPAPEPEPTLDPWNRTRDHPGWMVFPHAGMPEELRPPGWVG